MAAADVEDMASARQHDGRDGEDEVVVFVADGGADGLVAEALPHMWAWRGYFPRVVCAPRFVWSQRTVNVPYVSPRRCVPI